MANWKLQCHLGIKTIDLNGFNIFRNQEIIHGYTERAALNVKTVDGGKIRMEPLTVFNINYT